MNKTPRSETRIGASETAHRSRDPSRRGAVVEPSGDIPRSRPGLAGETHPRTPRSSASAALHVTTPMTTTVV